MEAAHILNVGSSSPDINLEAHVLPVEACVPPKPLGPSEARVLPVEVHIPPKPLGPLDSPSSLPSSLPPNNPCQWRNPSSHTLPILQSPLDNLSMHKLLKYTRLLAQPAKPLAKPLAIPQHPKPLADPPSLPSASARINPEYDSEDDSEDNLKEDSPAFDVLVSARYKTVANCVCLVCTTLPEEYRIVRHLPLDPLLSLPTLPVHPPDFSPSEKFTKE